MMVPSDWRWLQQNYHGATAVLEEFPELQAIDPRLPGLMLQVQSAETLMKQILDKAANDATDD